MLRIVKFSAHSILAFISRWRWYIFFLLMFPAFLVSITAWDGGVLTLGELVNIVLVSLVLCGVAIHFLLSLTLDQLRWRRVMKEKEDAPR